MEVVRIEDVISALRCTVYSGEQFLNRKIETSDLSRPGVELAGFFEYYDADRIQVFGKTEIEFISQMSNEKAQAIVNHLAELSAPAFIVTRNLEVPIVLAQAAQKYEIPILKSSAKTTSIISTLTNFLESKLAPRESVHGVFLDIFGMGVLITGKSGVGKSETALELIQKGHRLVADDRIDFHQSSDEFVLVGEAPAILKNLLEIRGVGIIDVMTLFGVGAVNSSKRLDLIVHLELWEDKTKKFDRLGNKTISRKILDVNIPQINIPVQIGRNIANIIEVATMNYRAKSRGFDATKTFENNLTKLIQKNTQEESND